MIKKIMSNYYVHKMSEQWNAIPDIQTHKCKIGNQNYWFDLLNQYGIKH